METGTIILLNGTSSAGKTMIAKALQENLDGYYLHTGIDHFLERVPQNFHVISKGGEPSEADGWLWVFKGESERVSETRLGPEGLKMRKGEYRAYAELARAGNNLIIDDVLFDPRVLKEAVRVLPADTTVFVGVRCPLEIAVQREESRGDRMLGLVEAHFDKVHAHQRYDLEIDTSILSTEESVGQIAEYLQNGSTPTAIRELRNRL